MRTGKSEEGRPPFMQGIPMPQGWHQVEVVKVRRRNTQACTYADLTLSPTGEEGSTWVFPLRMPTAGAERTRMAAWKACQDWMWAQGLSSVGGVNPFEWEGNRLYIHVADCGDDDVSIRYVDDVAHHTGTPKEML